MPFTRNCPEIRLGDDGDHDGLGRQLPEEPSLLEDELTVVIRARAMTAAFFTMMAGATVALALTLTLPHPAFGAIALLATIAGGGLTAGVRFAWLDREAGRDG